MKFTVGLLLGVGIGVVVGLLIAPQTGEQTRALLQEQGIMLRSGATNDTIRARANEALAQGREIYARTRDELTARYNQTQKGNL